MRNNFHDLLIISSCQCSIIIIHSRGITRNTYSLAQTPILAYNLIIILQNTAVSRNRLTAVFCSSYIKKPQCNLSYEGEDAGRGGSFKDCVVEEAYDTEGHNAAISTTPGVRCKPNGMRESAVLRVRYTWPLQPTDSSRAI